MLDADLAFRQTDADRRTVSIFLRTALSVPGRGWEGSGAFYLSLYKRAVGGGIYFLGDLSPSSQVSAAASPTSMH